MKPGFCADFGGRVFLQNVANHVAEFAVSEFREGGRGVFSSIVESVV